MIVRCDNCGTEFGFDDRQVGEGVTVRCSVCKHVFKVESRTPQPVVNWQVRTPENTTFTAPDVATLREWIRENRLYPDDQVSRTGRNWVPLGSMPEFADAFAGFEEVKPVVRPVAQPVAQSVAKPVAPPVAPPSQPARAPQVAPRPAAPPPTATAQPRSAPARRVSPPAVATPAPPVASLSTGPGPQSSRQTLSPPRSSPPQSPAPVSRKLAQEIEDLDFLDDDDPTEAHSVLTASAAEREPRDEAPTRVHARKPSEPRPAAVPVARSLAADLDDDDGDDDDDDDELDELDAFEAPAPRRRIGPVLVAFVGVAAAVGVMFGVPQIREKLLDLAGDDAADPGAAQAGVVSRPEITAADTALLALGTAELARAEAGLQRAIDAGDADPAVLAAMKLALADLLLNRAINYEIAAVIDDAQREDFRRRAREDQEDGDRLVDGLEGVADVDRLAGVRALARLAAGRAEAEVLPLVPKPAAELALIVRAAVLWQDLDAPVPPGLLAGLQALPNRTGLGEAALALALLRAGDTTAANNTAERLLTGAEDQMVGLAIRSRVGTGELAGDSDANDTSVGETDGSAAADITNVAKAPPPPQPGDDEGGGSGGGGGGGALATLVMSAAADPS
ncbi:zinc-ribbon domain-containing protein, partial [Enhygromyxa salina]|uniref:zinc-ribbon domain-containing protein n=1 Tax=Enhygromyxa salina TaxID=215803 RepID=UPI0015E79DCE